MNITELSIKRPTFISSIMIAIITVGFIAFQKMSVELFPNIDIPTIFVSTSYTGAAPSEIETLVTKPLEEEISTISGIKTLSSRSQKDVSQIIIQLHQGSDIRYIEQQVRDKINQTRNKLPKDIGEPFIRRVDPSDQPIVTVVLESNLDEAKLFDLADNYIRPRLEQVEDVGMVEILGARKREIQILLDQDALRNRNISLSQINSQLASSGQNVSIGKNDEGEKENIFRSASEFNSLDQIKNTLVNFYSNEVATKISDVGEVIDGLEDEKSRAFVNGKRSLFLTVYRQSDANIIKVVNGVDEAIEKIEKNLAANGEIKLTTTKDASKYIRSNIRDIFEAIIIAVILTVLTVFFFLANSRATIITAISLPISLVGAFIIMYVADFSINVISLLALSLAVGLLVDDAIVVVENIYRKIEHGMKPVDAAIASSHEILMAVVAISAVVISVFVPISFMKGIIGQYLKQFGLTISFAMLISLIVAISIIPMLCAFLSGKNFVKITEADDSKRINRWLKKFDKFQNYLEDKYEEILLFSIKYPKKILLSTLLILVLSVVAFMFVPKTFMAESDNGELNISIELEPNANLEKTTKAILGIDEIIRKNPEVVISAASAGGGSSRANTGSIYVRLKNRNDRDISTSDFKDKLRKQLKSYSYAHPRIRDYDPSGGVSRGSPFNLYLISSDSEKLDAYAKKLTEKLEQDPRLKDVESSEKETREEFLVYVHPNAAKIYGINPQSVGNELRGYVEGYTPTMLRQHGLEYEIRLRLKEEQRDLKSNFNKIYVPNINNRLVKLSDIASSKIGYEPATINRQDRGRYVRLTANLATGVGLGDVIGDIEKNFASGALALPPEIRYDFSGDSENMKDMQKSMIYALLIAVTFIYLILASLYESFVVPFTILLALPLAFCGAFYALLIMGENVNIFTMLGIFMLVGVSGKNSILLIDFANRLIAEGKSSSEAMVIAGRLRLRPILMTSLALIVGTLPVAIGFSETSAMRTSMGVAIIGGLISSTLLTLAVVLATFSYINRFRIWSKDKLAKFVE